VVPETHANAGLEAGLRQTIETLAAIDRPACSPGEREAAEWIAARLRELGCAARVEEELSDTGYARPMAALGGLGVLAGLAALRGRRALGGLVAVLVAAGIAEDISNGPRVFRRLTMRRKRTANVVALGGDASADRTLVVLAHHDAAPTGFVFHPEPQRRLAEVFPDFVERTDTSLPLWWLGIAPQVLIAAGSALKVRPLVGTGVGLGALATAAAADIARNRVVPGANDNLSGVAAALAVAEALAERPVEGLRVMFVSCGAEEVLQGGIHGFVKRHLGSLPRDRAWVVNLETVGSPRLGLLEGEGPIVMEDFEPRFKDLVAEEAAAGEIPLRRGLRSRNSTDSVIPHRAGFPVATLISITKWKALANYHWPTDTPENVDYSTVANAVALTERVMRRLGGTSP
jgi:hypothetical protein